MRRALFLPCLTGCAAVLLACDDPSHSPSEPSTTDRGLEPNGSSSWDGSGSRKHRELIAIDGPGFGSIRARRVPHPTTPGNFAIHIVVSVRHALPSTSYLVQRAPETFAPPGAPTGFDLATTTDGSCQRAFGLAPWSTLSPAPASFLTFPNQGTGTPVITTDTDGDGSADFVFALAFPLPTFDVTFRVLENSPAPTSVLQSRCTTLRE